MKIVASIPAGKVFGQGRLVFTDGHIWVITGRNGNQLTGIDAATNRPGPVIKLPVGCSDLAQGAGAVWVLCPVANRVVRVDVAHRLIQGTLTLAAPYAGFGTRTDLWVGSGPKTASSTASTPGRTRSQNRSNPRASPVEAACWSPQARSGRRGGPADDVSYLLRLRAQG